MKPNKGLYKMLTECLINVKVTVLWEKPWNDAHKINHWSDRWRTKETNKTVLKC